MTYINCPSNHNCGEVVSLDLQGFTATEAILGACSIWQAEAIKSFNVPKSTAIVYSVVFAVEA